MQEIKLVMRDIYRQQIVKVISIVEEEAEEQEKRWKYREEKKSLENIGSFLKKISSLLVSQSFLLSPRALKVILLTLENEVKLSNF